MKLRIVKLTPEQLVALLQGKPSFLASKLPSDAELFDVKMDLFEKQVCMVVRSDSFSDVGETDKIPELELTKTLPQPTAALLPQPKVSVAKPVQPSKTAIKMENEFSPDQRKLLSFTVKGDIVVVKPTMFLKAEWEDINEVVKSLGGRWVKGDIISYWEIPQN